MAYAFDELPPSTLDIARALRDSKEMRARCLFCLSSVMMLVACGGAPPPEPVTTPAQAPVVAATTTTPETPKKKAAEPVAPKLTPFPTECAKAGDKICVPSKEAADKLCDSPNPDVALALFAKGTPWTRGYLTRQLEAWNPGSRVAAAKMAAYEEVIIIRHRSSNSGGMVLNGSTGGYDALRWNGSCVALAGDEVALRHPGMPKHSDVPWKKLDAATRDALLSDYHVKVAFDQRRKDCEGSGDSDAAACVRLDGALSRAIVNFVRGGGKVPAPSSLP